MVRQLIGKFLVALLALTATTVGSPSSVSAGNSVVMPFACQLDKGQPKLTSSAPNHHEIVGPRQQRSYTACRDAARRDCQTMMVHSFNLRCEGKSVPWWKVAAQVRSEAVGRSWIEDGRLNLLLKNRANSNRKRVAQFVLPPGYAPIGEIGARLAIKPEAPTKPAEPKKTVGEPASVIVTGATGGDKQSKAAAAIENAIVVEPIPQASSVPALLDNRSALDPWLPVVQHADATTQLGAAATGGSYSLLALFGGLIATCLLGTFGWLVRQRYRLAVSPGPSQQTTHPIATRSFGPIFSKALALSAFVSNILSGLAAKSRARWLGWKWRNFTADRPRQWRNASIANGARSAEALYEKAETAVRSLGPVSALRDTLTTELKVVRQRLEALRGSPGEDTRTARLASSLRSAVRDLERIGRIADSAAASLKNGREDRSIIPKTRAEAYEILGVNPNASEASLKRTVDALRMGWHPDHAKDDADKVIREERTKQINIAWDLIVGKRAA